MTLPAPPSPLNLGITTEFLRKQAPELARDIVAKIDGATALALHYGLTEAQWAILRESEWFRSLVQQAMTEMSGSLGVHERIKRKAAMALDQVGVLDAATIAGNEKVTPSVRLSALEFLKDVAEVGGKAKTGFAGGGSGGGPLVVINLPGRMPVTLDMQPATDVPSDD